MPKDGKIKIAENPCPKCSGQVMMDYKHKWWLGKCAKCSRIWNMKGEKGV